MMLVLTFVLCALLLSIPLMLESASRGESWAPIAVVGVAVIVLCFYFWPLYTT